MAAKTKKARVRNASLGGWMRSRTLSAKRRSAIARAAAKARWDKVREESAV